jgi:hypothetical protein
MTEGQNNVVRLATLKSLLKTLAPNQGHVVYLCHTSRVKAADTTFSQMNNSIMLSFISWGIAYTLTNTFTYQTITGQAAPFNSDDEPVLAARDEGYKLLRAWLAERFMVTEAMVGVPANYADLNGTFECLRYDKGEDGTFNVSLVDLPPAD